MLRFSKRLGLDDAQIRKIRKDLFATKRKLLKEQARLRLNRLEVRQLSSSAKPNVKAISRHLDKIADAAATIAKLRLGLWQRTRDTLTPEQRAALAELRWDWQRGRPRPGPRGPGSW